MRLVCTLLDTCGQYFDRGSSKKKLDRFLVYFQRYILTKQLIPMDVEFMLSDCLESLRPGLVRHTNMEQVNTIISNYEKEDQLVQQQLLQKSQQSTARTSVNKSNTGDHESGDERSNSDGEDEEENGSDRELEHEDVEEVETQDPEDLEDDSDEEDEKKDTFDEDNDRGEYSRNMPVRVRTADDDEFEREFKKIMQESIESRKLISSSS